MAIFLMEGTSAGERQGQRRATRGHLLRRVHKEHRPNAGQRARAATNPPCRAPVLR